MQVKIKNFQSVENAELEVDGFTVLVGKSNIGKSAVIRAIQGALTNKEGDDFVTHGEDHCEVSLETPNLSLLWQKGGGLNNYTVNGEELHRVGRGAPEQIAEAGFKELEVGRDSISVQIADQFSPLFLLNESGSLAAEAISDIGRLSDIQTALRDCDKDRREANATRKVREQDLEDTRLELEAYDEYDDFMKQVDEVRKYYREIALLGKDIDQIEQLDTRRSRLMALVEVFSPVLDLEIVSWQDDDLVKEINALSSLEAARQKAIVNVDKYEDVDSLEVPVWDEDDLVSEIEALTRMVTSLSRISKVVKSHKGLSELDMPVVSDLDGEVTECRRLAGWCADLERIVSSIPTLKQDISDLEEAAEKAHKELHDVLEEAGTCPMCEREVS